MAKMKITLKKSVIGSNKSIRENVKSLGLHKTNDTVIHEDTPDIRGKITKIQHLVAVEEVTQ
jgi:large subunit ribosomal protein L30